MSAHNQLIDELDKEVVAEAKETDAEVGIFMLIDSMPSGFIREGTEDLPPDQQDQIMFPSYRSILIESAYRQKRSKKEGGGYKRIPIRYRYGCESIDPKEQEKLGFEEPDLVNGHILFKNGNIIIVGDGATEGMLKFARKDSRNETNPDRIPTVPAVYREIFPDKETEEGNDDDFALGKVLSLIETLILDKTPGAMRYDEPRLQALAQYFRVVAEKPGGLIRGLIATAKIDPAKFLREANAFEEQTMMLIAQAEKLGVIKFEQNRVILQKTPPVVLHTFSPKLDDKQKYRSLAGVFQTPEGLGKLKEFTFELEEAKKRNIEANKQ